MARFAFVFVVALCLASASISLVEAIAADLGPEDIPYIWDLTDGDDKGIGGGFDIVDDLRVPPWVTLSLPSH